MIPVNDQHSICPSGGHGRGHRLALQNRAADRNNPLTVNDEYEYCVWALGWGKPELRKILSDIWAGSGFAQNFAK